MQHHGDQLDAVALGRGGKAVPCGGRVAGLQSRRSLIKPDELVGVGQTEPAVPDGVHPDGHIPADIVVLQQLPRHHGNVVRAGQMLGGARLVVEAGAVDKMRICQLQLGSAGVHHLDKRGLAARDVLCQRRGAVVGGADDDGLEHLVHAHLLARLQIDLAAALPGGVVGGGDGIDPRDAPAFQRLHDQKQRHDLRHRGGRELFVRIFFKKNGAGRGVHQNRGRRGNVRPHRVHRRNQSEQQQPGEQNRNDSLIHKKSPRFIVVQAYEAGAGIMIRRCIFWRPRQSWPRLRRRRRAAGG